VRSPKTVLRGAVYAAVPGAQSFWIRLNDLLGRGAKCQFDGWGMTTTTFVPWRDTDGDRPDVLVTRFVSANEELLRKVADREFYLSAAQDIQDKLGFLRQLMYRHYYVAWSAHYAGSMTSSSEKTLVECGVCDGMSAHFAMRALGDTPFRTFLYDAFEGMKGEYLLDSENHSLGRYSYLSIDIPKKNLAVFADRVTYCQGFIPDSFSRHDNPQQLAWLHIDLNSSMPTTATLEYFFDRIERGGVVLFDDYAWPAFSDTKRAVDRFLRGKAGALLPLPTGQAIYFKW